MSGSGSFDFNNCRLQTLLIPKQQILDASKLKQFADDNSKVDENGRKFSEWVENTVEKGEIAVTALFRKIIPTLLEINQALTILIV